MISVKLLPRLSIIQNQWTEKSTIHSTSTNILLFSFVFYLVRMLFVLIMINYYN